MRKREIITIDGPAGSGKSTLGKALAKALGFLYLDTGAMYRAVALASSRKGIGIHEEGKLKGLCRDLPLTFDTTSSPPRLFLGGEDISSAIRTPEMDLLSSAVSAVAEVRIAMTGLQRRIAEEHDLVAEGRDMGTVVFPWARHKFFLTAEPQVRAERRYRERISRGERVELQDVLREMMERDSQDSQRQIAPLKPASDAHIIDTTNLSVEEVLSELITRVRMGLDLKQRK